MPDIIFHKAFHSGGVLNLSPKDALEACQAGAVLIDLREEYLTEYKVFDVPRFILCPLSMMEEWKAHLPHDTGLILADATGIRSRETMIKLMHLGYDKLTNLAGGLLDWEREGLPITIDKGQRLTGSCMCQLKPREKKQ